MYSRDVAQGMSQRGFLSGNPVFYSGDLTQETSKLRRRKLRYFRLVDGALYSCRRRGDPPYKAYDVVDCAVMREADGVSVTLRDGKLLKLKVNSDRKREEWADAVLRASKRKVTRFYRIDCIIGSGSFAEVRLGYVRATGQQVAIKVLRKDKKDRELMNAVNCELNFASLNIRHENIVKTYDVINTRDMLYIVMEYMKGGMLYDVLERERMLSEKKASQVMFPVLKALRFLHDNKVIHRDIKPENVLCAGREWPLAIKLGDFGLADVIVGSEAHPERSTVGMYGTPFFIAPEVVRGDKYGPAVDMWSCGVLLYNMLSGMLPFEGETLPAVFNNVKNGKVEFNAPCWNFISSEAKGLLLGLLEYNPLARLTAAEALAHPWFQAAQHLPDVHKDDERTINSLAGEGSSIAVEDVKALLKEVQEARAAPRLMPKLQIGRRSVR